MLRVPDRAACGPARARRTASATDAANAARRRLRSPRQATATAGPRSDRSCRVRECSPPSPADPRRVVATVPRPVRLDDRPPDRRGDGSAWSFEASPRADRAGIDLHAVSCAVPPWRGRCDTGWSPRPRGPPRPVHPSRSATPTPEQRGDNTPGGRRRPVPSAFRVARTGRDAREAPTATVATSTGGGMILRRIERPVAVTAGPNRTSTAASGRYRAQPRWRR
jgi:hypothetical protein